MKRTPLKRKTPLTRKTALRLGWKPSKAELEQRAGMRNGGKCWLCGERYAMLHVHEITRGAHRQKSVADRRGQLVLCNLCHEKMDDYSKWPLVKQYALKALRDPEYFVREWLNRARGRADDAISADDVDDAARELVTSGEVKL